MRMQTTKMINNHLFVVNSSTGDVIRELKPISVTCKDGIWYYYNRLAQYQIKQHPKQVEYSKYNDVVYVFIGNQKYEYMKPVRPVAWQREEMKKERLAFQS